MQLFSRTFHCPDVITQEDEIIIEETLQNAPGIESIEVDRAMHLVTVTTANQSGTREIEAMLRDAGYPAEEREEAAALKSQPFYTL
jgi:copper chaperone CopZ